MIYGRKENLRREIASLTKMMTFFTVIDLMKQFKLNAETYKITVSTLASQISGTSAFLREGDTLTVSQLLYGLMLPSGNDAAFLLAEHFGEMLHTSKYA